MSKTVHDLRNDIRVAVDRYEREVSAGFTKEALAAISAAVDHDVDETGRLPPKADMRAGILWRVGELDEPDRGAADRPFRKGELETIAAAVRPEDSE